MSKIGRVDSVSVRHQPAQRHVDITVSTDFASCRREWLTLQDRAITTVFQTYEWLEAWQSHVGQHNTVQPIIVIGKHLDGRTMFILPFGLVIKNHCRILTWLSHPHNNYGYGVFDKSFLQDCPGEFPTIWRKIQTVLPKVDAIVLHNQPAHGGGFDNPFAQLATCPSADSSYILELTDSMEDLQTRKFSSRSRRRLRQQERELDGLGSWRIVEARSDAEIARAASATFAQKQTQLTNRGIANPFDQPFKEFFQRFASARYGISRALRCYYLELDGEIIATNFGAVHAGTYYGLITSMADGPLKRFSPGSMVMRYAIERSCEDGVRSFDFSAGSSQYKTRWADSELPLFETLIPLSAKGRVYCMAEWLHITVKRRVKHSPFLWSRIKKLRALFRR